MPTTINTGWPFIDLAANVPTSTPTIVAGDVTITRNGVTTNTINLPVTTIDNVSITLEDDEYVGGAVIKFKDQSDPAEWQEGIIILQSDTVDGDGGFSPPPASDVRLGVDRGDGVLGTLVDYSEPTPEAGVLEFVEHDEYDGISHDKKTWTTRENLTGKSITLLMFDKHDPTRVAGRFDGTVDSATSVSVSMSAEFDYSLDFNGCPGVAELAWYLIAHDGTGQETFEPSSGQPGRAYVYGRPLVSQ